MKKLLVAFLACLPAFAVGTVQQSFQQLGNTSTFVLAVNWTGDSINGTVPATLANLGGLTIQGYRIFSVEVAPGSPAPSTNYSLTLTTFLGTDALAGAGSSLSATLPTTLQAPSTAAPVNGVLTINIAGNSVANAQGRFLVYFTPVFQVMGLPSVNAAGNNTFSGNNTFTGINTFSNSAVANPLVALGTTANGNPMVFDTTAAGSVVGTIYRDAGTNKWVVGKDASNNFNIFDVANGITRISVQPGGATLFNSSIFENCSSGGSVGAALCVAGTTATTGGIDIFNGQLGVSANERLTVLPTNGNVIANNFHVQQVSAGALNGTDTLAVSSAGLVTTYNTTATQGQGVTWIPCATSQRTETAADTNLLTCAIPAQAGSYRVRFMLDVSAANAATLGFQVCYIDSNGANPCGNVALFQYGAAAPALTFTTSVAGNYYGTTDISVNASGTSPVVKLTFSGTSFTGKASATVERII